MGRDASCATVVPGRHPVLGRVRWPSVPSWGRRRCGAGLHRGGLNWGRPWPMHDLVDGAPMEPGPYGMTFGDPASGAEDPNRMRDVLDRETIEKIEELHAVV